nr:putative peptidase [uncultured bacterium]
MSYAERDIVKRVMPAVVQVVALKKQYRGNYAAAWTGSGTLVHPQGVVLTNCHVANPRAMGMPAPPADLLGIAITDRSDQPPALSYIVEIVAQSPRLDLAVLRVTRDVNGRAVKKLALPWVPIGNSDELELGDIISIFGYPGIGGETITFTSGSISGFTQQRDVTSGRAWIKTDATIAGGNSGGTAVSQHGYLVGIPTQAAAGTRHLTRRRPSRRRYQSRRPYRRARHANGNWWLHQRPASGQSGTAAARQSGRQAGQIAQQQQAREANRETGHAALAQTRYVGRPWCKIHRPCVQPTGYPGRPSRQPRRTVSGRQQADFCQLQLQRYAQRDAVGAGLGARRQADSRRRRQMGRWRQRAQNHRARQQPDHARRHLPADSDHPQAGGRRGRSHDWAAGRRQRHAGVRPCDRPWHTARHRGRARHRAQAQRAHGRLRSPAKARHGLHVGSHGQARPFHLPETAAKRPELRDGCRGARLSRYGHRQRPAHQRQRPRNSQHLSRSDDRGLAYSRPGGSTDWPGGTLLKHLCHTQLARPSLPFSPRSFSSRPPVEAPSRCPKRPSTRPNYLRRLTPPRRKVTTSNRSNRCRSSRKSFPKQRSPSRKPPRPNRLNSFSARPAGRFCKRPNSATASSATQPTPPT